MNLPKYVVLFVIALMAVHFISLFFHWNTPIGGEALACILATILIGFLDGWK